jgi:hypothetical protein
MFMIALTPSSDNATGSRKSPFVFNKTMEGIELSENGKPVFFYQISPRESKGSGIYNNYFHPVYNLQGEVITEEFPKDHLNHRGIFWAWHQVFINDLNLGDGWIMENMTQSVTNAETETNNKFAVLNTTVLWKSSRWQNQAAFIEEKATVKVYKSENNIRKIDFEITLAPLVAGVSLGGSDDEKGYGGFCTRIKMPDDLVFISEKGPVKPHNLQVNSGPWMDFCWTSAAGIKNGLAILCHPSDPEYPAPWILRQKASMQNIVFPGRERTKLEKPLVLRYRVIIHNGDTKSAEMAKLQEEFKKVLIK